MRHPTKVGLSFGQTVEWHGTGLSLPVLDLALTNGVLATGTLAPREVAYNS